MKSIVWTGKGHNASWFDAGNWASGVPVGGQSVVFDDGGAWNISLGGTHTAQAGATVVSGDTLTFHGGRLMVAAAQPSIGFANDLVIDNGGSVTVARGATLISPTAIALGGTSSGTLDIFGKLDASIIQIAQSTLSASGPAAHIVLSNGQTVEIGDGVLALSDGARLDAGPSTLDTFYSSMIVGGDQLGGTVSVAGAGTRLTIGILYLGNGDNGVLQIADGGVARVGVVYAGRYGDGLITVSGAHSVLAAVNEVAIGDANNLPVGSELTVTDGGAVHAGHFGLRLEYGTLKLDASASIAGTIVSEVGQIEALPASAGGSVVTLANPLYLEFNDGGSGQFGYTTTVSSVGNATLSFTGKISGEQNTILSAGAGHVVLANAADSYPSTSLYDATLEIAATGAAGAGALTFTGGPATHPVLQIDAGVHFGNTIAGFAGHDLIDLRGFAFSTGLTDMLAAGTLTLTDGPQSTTLTLSGTYRADGFTFASDQHGGTFIALGGG